MSKPERLFLRRPAADYVAEQTGAPMSHRTLEEAPVPFRIINKRAVYRQTDLDAYVTHLLDGPRRTGFRRNRAAHHARWLVQK